MWRAWTRRISVCSQANFAGLKFFNQLKSQTQGPQFKILIGGLVLRNFKSWKKHMVLRRFEFTDREYRRGALITFISPQSMDLSYIWHTCLQIWLHRTVTQLSHYEKGIYYIHCIYIIYIVNQRMKRNIRAWRACS